MADPIDYPDAKRIALLSDTHGHLDTRVADIVASCDCAVHAGDIGTAEVLGLLTPAKPRVVAVLGNNDRLEKWQESDHNLLRTLPEEAWINLDGGRLVVVHGHKAGSANRRHDWLRRRYPDARLIVYGHSHRLTCDQGAVPWVVNPGSAGRSRTYGGPSCLVLSIAQEGWFIETFRFAVLGRTGSRARRNSASRVDLATSQ